MGLGISNKFDRQAEMLANKVKKRYQHLRKRFERQNIDVFRLYDWDIPEIRAIVDWYAGHLVIGEYTRQQSTPEWLPEMGKAVGEVLGVSAENVHLKERFYGRRDGKRYQRIDHTDRLIAVSERDLKFYVNPWDYVDTGLFADHRDTRQLVRKLAAGKDFLNLFCYSGSFSCYAAKGGARTTVSVDRSRTAVQWTRRNLRLNGIPDKENRVIQDHAADFIERIRQKDQRFDLAVVDPPSFYSIRRSGDHFDIVRDHPALLESVLSLMRRDAIVFFSTNHQNFAPRLDGLPVRRVEEITAQTIPEDYRHKRKQIHRCWRLRV